MTLAAPLYPLRFTCSTCIKISLLNIVHRFCRTLPSKDLKKVADQLSKYNIQGLLIVGGFEVRLALQTRFHIISSFRSFSTSSQHLQRCVSHMV